MKILTAAQIRQADQITLQRQGIPSFELMQRAATVCAAKIRSLYPPAHPVSYYAAAGTMEATDTVLPPIFTETDTRLPLMNWVRRIHLHRTAKWREAWCRN